MNRALAVSRIGCKIWEKHPSKKILYEKHFFSKVNYFNMLTLIQ